MAKLYQSEYREIVARRSGQDINTLIMLLETDGKIEIVDDPSEDEIKKAREQAAKDAEKQQKEAETEAAATRRVAGMTLPEDQGMDDLTENPPEGSEVKQGTDKATTKSGSEKK